jgi:hypothetical protein
VLVDEGPTAALPEWVRTVPVGERFTTRNGKAVVLTCIDLWADRVALHFAFESDVSIGRPGGGGAPMWAVRDDVGTRYQPMGGGSGGSDGLCIGYQLYGPSAPEDAQLLTVSSPDLRFPIEIRL